MGGEVEDARRPPPAHERGGRLRVAQVGLGRLDVPAHVREAPGVAARPYRGDDVVALPQQSPHEVRADEARGAGDEAHPHRAASVVDDRVLGVRQRRAAVGTSTSAGAAGALRIDSTTNGGRALDSS